MALTEGEQRLLQLYAEGELVDRAELRFVRERLATSRDWREALAEHDRLTWCLFAGEAAGDDAFSAPEAARDRCRRVEDVLARLERTTPPEWLAAPPVAPLVDLRGGSRGDRNGDRARERGDARDAMRAAIVPGPRKGAPGRPWRSFEQWAAMVVLSGFVLLLVLRGREDGPRDGVTRSDVVPVARIEGTRRAHALAERRRPAAELHWSLVPPRAARAESAALEAALLRGFASRNAALAGGSPSGPSGLIAPELELLVLLGGGRPALDHPVVLVPSDWDGEPASLLPIRSVISWSGDEVSWTHDAAVGELADPPRESPRFYRVFLQREVRVPVIPALSLPAPSGFVPGAGMPVAAPAFVPVLDTRPGSAVR